MTWSYDEGFLADRFDADALFTQLLAEVDWTSQMRSRQTASMGIPYNYAGASYPEAPFHAAVADVAALVRDRFGFTPTNCLLNHYPTGDHALGWHADDVTILAPDTGIAIVSLGAVRTLSIRKSLPAEDGAVGFEYTRVPLAPGSVLHMSQAMQADHKHALKRERGAGARISLTFRHLTHAPPPVDRPAWGQS